MEVSTDKPPELPAVPSTGDDNRDLIDVPKTETIVNMPPDNTVSEVKMDCKLEIVDEEGRNILEVIALTGKFWLDWEKLKILLSNQLKQVLSLYPESKMSTEDQNALLGETYAELVKRLDEALCSFIEGPPFTLQRLCEILLSARDIYPKLSKLALALEKNLLVTSTLTISTDPYPPPITKSSNQTDEPEKNEEPEKKEELIKNEKSEKNEEPIKNEEPEKSEELIKKDEPQPETNSIQNGIEHATTDKDEVMVEADAAEENDDMKVDEASEGKCELPTPDLPATTDIKPVDSQKFIV